MTPQDPVQETNVHAELEITFKTPVVWETASKVIKDVIGPNEVDVSTALAGTSLETTPNVVNFAVAAEQVINAATIIYFREGSDTIRIYVAVRSLSEAKKQCARIARQLPERIGTLSKANANVFVRVLASYQSIVTGERTSFGARMWSAVSEKMGAKMVSSAATFALASHFMSGTPAVASAAIGVAAAAVGILVEATSGASRAAEWKWKELA